MHLLDLHLGRPLTRGALTLFPVWNGAAVDARGYDAGSGCVSAAECPHGAVVGQLALTNHGHRPALVLEGELLEGGRQHRVAARSALVPPGATELLDVRCVEQGRWAGSTTHVRRGRRAPVSVRAAEHQASTWQRVHRFEQRYGASASASLLEATSTADDRATALVAGVRPLPAQAGLLICIAGLPVQLEAYDSPRTLWSCWDALLHAAALDALDAEPVATPGRRARSFVDRVSRLHLSETGAKLGKTVCGRSAVVRLTALVWRNRAVHAVAVNLEHPLANA